MLDASKICALQEHLGCNMRQNIWTCITAGWSLAQETSDWGKQRIHYLAIVVVQIFTEEKTRGLNAFILALVLFLFSKTSKRNI